MRVYSEYGWSVSPKACVRSHGTMLWGGGAFKNQSLAGSHCGHCPLRSQWVLLGFWLALGSELLSQITLWLLDSSCEHCLSCTFLPGDDMKFSPESSCCAMILALQNCELSSFLSLSTTKLQIFPYCAGKWANTETQVPWAKFPGLKTENKASSQGSSGFCER